MDEMEAAALARRRQRLPAHALDIIKQFAAFTDRLHWYLARAPRQDESWIDGVCKPSVFEVDMFVHDVGAACARESLKTGRDHVGRSDICTAGECIDIYTNHALLHFVLSDEAFASIRFAKVSLEEALHRYGKGVSVSKTVCSAIGDSGCEENESTCVLLEILKHVDNLPMIDRARSYVLASKLENERVMVQVVEKFPIDAAMYPCEAYHELLVAACTAGHTAMVAQLLEHGAHPLEIDENGESLTSAVRYNHLEVVHQLEAAGQIPANGAIIVNGLRLACTRGSISMVDTLLAHYASASNAWDHHPTLLRSAVQSDNLQVVKLLLECDPRGAFIRMDQLIDQLQREMTAGGSTPRLDAIIGKHGYFAWDLHAFETAVRKNDTVLFDLLVNHIEWDRGDLKAAFAAATKSGNAPMAKIIDLLLQSILDESVATPSEPPVFAPGDKIEARKRGRATFSLGTIQRCWVNGTYDVKFSEVQDSEHNGEDKENDARDDSRTNSSKSNGGSMSKIEKQLHPQMIRYRSLRNMGRIDTTLATAAAAEIILVDAPAIALTATSAVSKMFSATATDKVQSKADANGLVQSGSMLFGNEDHEDDKAIQAIDKMQPTLEFKADTNTLVRSDSLLFENEDDEDDKAIRADAAIIRDREEASHVMQCLESVALPQGGSLEDEIEVFPRPNSSRPSSSGVTTSAARITALGAVQPRAVSSNTVVQGSVTEEPAVFMEGDVIEAKCMGSTMFYPGRITFCHANGLYDIVFDDGDEDTLVPRALIRLLKPKKKKQKSQTTDIVAVSTATNTRTDVTRDDNAINATQLIPNVQERIDAAHSVPLPVEPVAHVTHLPAAVNHQVETQIGDEECARLNKQFGKTAACHTPESSSDAQPEQQQHHKQEELQGETPMSDASASLRNLSSQLQATEVNVNKHILHITPKADAGARPTAIKSAHRQTSSSCGARGKRMSTVPAALPLASWKELEEWRNVDLILNRKRRFLNSQSGSIESSRVPWGEEFAAIQSLKRFAAQHPDVLRDHIATQMDEVVGVTLVTSSGRDGRACQSARTPSTEWPSCSSGAAAAGNAREALLLVKDLAFLLKQRLAPFLNVILPTVLPAVFSVEKRFLRDIAYEVLEALVLHCSGRRLVMLLLQHGEACAQGDDLRLFNLTNVYVERCFAKMNAAEIQHLMTRSCAATLLSSLAGLLACKSAPSKIEVQNTLAHIHAALGEVAFERVVCAELSENMARTVLRVICSSSTSDTNGSRSPIARSPVKQQQCASPVIAVHQGLSILQRMVTQRQNRVMPVPE